MAEVRVTSDVVYARHGIGYIAGNTHDRDLLLDVYEPTDGIDDGQRPAIVFAFGGAFHRGSKEDDSFSIGERFNTSAADYARYWAEQGYVTFSIDYRLMPEDPAPGDYRILESSSTLRPDRLQELRSQRGLPPATAEMLANTVEAGAMDADAAVSFIRRNAARWNIDAARIALWGWSAGARCMLSAALGRKSDVAAVISLSTSMDERDLARWVPEPQLSPALFLIDSERDFAFVKDKTASMMKWLQPRLPLLRHLTVLDRDHFYPADSPVRVNHTGHTTQTLLGAMDDFIRETIGLP